MPVIGMRQLSRETASVIEDLMKSGEPVVITKQGSPVATLSPVDPGQAQDLVLSLAPRIRESSSSTDVRVSPRKTRDLETVAAQLAEEASESEEGRAALARYSNDIGAQRVEALTEVERLFSEAPGRLSGVADSLVMAWMASTQALIGGTVEAALESARALQQRVASAHAVTRTGRPKGGATRAVSRSTRRAAGKSTSGVKVARSSAATAKNLGESASATKRRSRAR